MADDKPSAAEEPMASAAAGASCSSAIKSNDSASAWGSVAMAEESKTPAADGASSSGGSPAGASCSSGSVSSDADAPGSSSSSSRKMVMLVSEDQQMFLVEAPAAAMSVFLRNMMEDMGLDNPIPLSNISSALLAKVVEYFQFHYKAQQMHSPSEKIHSFETEYFQIDQPALLELIRVANYLDANELLDASCKELANRIQQNLMKKHGIQQVRDMFHIINDFTPEEEEQLMKENSWTFD